MLTETVIRNAKPKDKPYKLGDSRGLYLFVQPTGGKLWRQDYRFNEKRKTLALGSYPEISLSIARDKRDAARKLLAAEIDPGESKKAAKASKQNNVLNSFEFIAREWVGSHMQSKTEKYRTTLIRRFELYLFPWIGGQAITDISPSDLLDVIKIVQSQNKLETAYRTMKAAGQVFRYAVQHRRLAVRDITADLKGALPSAPVKHMSSFTEPKDVAELMRAMEGFTGTLTVQTALNLAPLVFVRPGELRKAEWAGINLVTAEWRYLVTKTGVEHIVPLSRQAVKLLRTIQPFSGHGKYVFQGGHNADKPMSEAAINAALRRMGYDTKTQITGHGFRAMARTILHERLNMDPHIIEHQLAHTVPDALGTAYNRTKFLEQRKVMMQQWADYLDELKAGAVVLPFKLA